MAADNIAQGNPGLEIVAESDYSIDCSWKSRDAFVLRNLVLKSWVEAVGWGRSKGRGQDRRICTSVQAALLDSVSTVVTFPPEVPDTR